MIQNLILKNNQSKKRSEFIRDRFQISFEILSRLNDFH